MPQYRARYLHLRGPHSRHQCLLLHHRRQQEAEGEDAQAQEGRSEKSGGAQVPAAGAPEPDQGHGRERPCTLKVPAAVPKHGEQPGSSHWSGEELD